MRILGLHIEGTFLKIAIVETRAKGQFKIQTLKAASCSDPINVKELYIDSASDRVTAAINASKLIVRRLNINIPKSRHIEEALAFQSDAASHLKPEDVMVVPHLIRQEGTKTDALLYIASREAIQENLNHFEKLNLEPDCISASPLSITEYACWKSKELQDAYVIHLGIKEWVCIQIEKGKLKKSHAILGGNEILLASLWEDRKKILLHKEVEGVAKQIDLLQLKSNLNPHLTKKLNEMKQEMAKTIFSFHREDGPKPYFFTGATDAFGHYTEFLAQNFKEAITKEIKTSASIEELKYAIPIGLCIEQTKSSLQLLRDQFFPRKNWKKSGVYALILISMSLLFSATFLFVSDRFLHSRKEKMIEDLSLILEKNDPEMKTEIFSQQDSHLLYNWVEAVDRYSKEDPYISKAPKVAEFLSWLSNHPLLETLKNEGSPIVIRDLNYQLVQYPHIGSLEEPYQVKVELEFETNSPMSARKFHQALLKGDEKIDSRQEIGWETLKNGYRTSFFLKNRSPYVP